MTECWNLLHIWQNDKTCIFDLPFFFFLKVGFIHLNQATGWHMHWSSETLSSSLFWCSRSRGFSTNKMLTRYGEHKINVPLNSYIGLGINDILFLKEMWHFLRCTSASGLQAICLSRRLLAQELHFRHDPNCLWDIIVILNSLWDWDLNQGHLCRRPVC